MGGGVLLEESLDELPGYGRGLLLWDVATLIDDDQATSGEVSGESLAEPKWDYSIASPPKHEGRDVQLRVPAGDARQVRRDGLPSDLNSGVAGVRRA